MGEMGVGGAAGDDGGLLLKHARASVWFCDIIPPSSIVANTLLLALDARSPPLDVRRSQDEDGDDCWVQVDIRGHPLQNCSAFLFLQSRLAQEHQRPVQVNRRRRVKRDVRTRPQHEIYLSLPPRRRRPCRVAVNLASAAEPPSDFNR